MGIVTERKVSSPIEELHGQKNYNVPLVAIPSKRYTQRDINKSSSGSALVLKVHHLRSTAVESHEFKTPLVAVWHY